MHVRHAQRALLIAEARPGALPSAATRGTGAADDRLPDASSDNAVCAIIVCFQPDLGVLAEVIADISDQVRSVLVVDNGCSAEVGAWLVALQREGKLWCLRQAQNLGVGTAYNLGMGWAKAHGHSHVLLLDQDSRATPTMVSRLFASLADLEKQGKRVAAIGPALFNESTHSAFPFIKLGLLTNRCYPDPAEAATPIEADIIISSGKLIPLEVIEAVGGMNEGLFVDNVDVEWCFRAASHGYKLFGAGNALMRHALGDGVHRIWFLRERLIIVHKPVRLYYMMRNRVHLYRMSFTPWLWIAQDACRLFLKLALFSMLISPRGENFRMMLRGLGDGLRGIAGPYRPRIGRARRQS